jgi:hypothetical protein
MNRVFGFNASNGACSTNFAGRSPLRDEPQDVGAKISRNGDLRHLKGDAAAWLIIFAPILISRGFAR